MKKAGIIAALLLVLSSGAMAAQESMIEETWKQQIPSAHLQYEKGHGDVDVWAGTERTMFEHEGLADHKNNNAGVSLGYGLTDKLEVRGFVNGGKSEAIGIPESEAVYHGYQGAVKGQIYNKNGLMVAGSGSVYYNAAAGASFDIDAFSNKVINENLTIYHNAGVTIGGAGLSARMTNGLQYQINHHHALKASFDSNYNHVGRNFATIFNAGVKSHLSEKTSNLLTATVENGIVDLANMIETKVNPSFLMRGNAHLNLGQSVDGSIGVDAEKQFGIVTVKGGVGHNLNISQGKALAVSAGLDVKLTDDLKVSVDAFNVSNYSNSGQDINLPEASISVNYKL